MPTESTAPPASARQLVSPAALALADLVGIFDDLQFVLRCCERLITELGREEQDDVQVEALWLTALTCYGRCFRSGERGMGLTTKDLADTGVEGEVETWHDLLGKLRKFFTTGAANPREAFSVGVTQTDKGRAAGIVITSMSRPLVDETTVRQIGRLAFELSALVDKKIKTQQEKVFAAAKELTANDLGTLDEIEVLVPEQA